jgi:DNA-binding transcriptional LysR family regulator
MEFNQIRYFLNLADTLNFTEEAMRSGVSQATLTRAIQRLEQELGGTLVYRDGKAATSDPNSLRSRNGCHG